MRPALTGVCSGPLDFGLTMRLQTTWASVSSTERASSSARSLLAPCMPSFDATEPLATPRSRSRVSLIAAQGPSGHVLKPLRLLSNALEISNGHWPPSLHPRML